MLKNTLIIMGLGLSSCATFQKTPVVKVVVSDQQAIEAYAKVLEDFVNVKGEIDFNGLQRSPQDLEDYVAYIAQKKWSDFKSSDELLAYHLNAYNALSMNTVIQKGIPETNAGFKKVQFFYLTKMEIGGQRMSLVTYETDFIRKMNEDRVHWALNCMAVSCPRLPRKPFAAETLNQDLQDLAVEFFNSDKNVRFDSDHKIVQVTEILKFFPEDFVPKKAATIVDYVNLYRQDKIPTNYSVNYIPYDWTINNSNRH